MTQFAQATLYGLLQGGLLALIAVGFSLVWGVMNVVNLAHGAFVLAGAYVALRAQPAARARPVPGHGAGRRRALRRSATRSNVD